MEKSLAIKASHLQLQMFFAQRNLRGARYRATVPLFDPSDSHKKSAVPLSIDQDESDDGKDEKSKCIININYLEQVSTFFKISFLFCNFWELLLI